MAGFPDLEHARALEHPARGPLLPFLRLWRDLESLISRLRETIYAYCDVGGFKTRLVSALLGHDSPVMEERVSMPSHQRLERFGPTRREVEILHLVGQGKTNKEIAADLYISPLTVRTHLERVYQKLGVGSHTEAVARVLKLVEIAE